MAGGIADPSAPPRVLLSYFAEDGLRQCSWTPDSGVDGPCPSVQVLPRRLLRALVNAKRTERLEPLGGAVGLPNLSATWAAVAKELGQRSKGLAEKGQSNLSILRSEINFKGSREDKIQALRSWLEEQTPAPMSLPVPPDEGAWRELHEQFLNDTLEEVSVQILEARSLTLLSVFSEVVAPGDTCPACQAGLVTESRLAEIREALANSRQAVERINLQAAVSSKMDACQSSVQAWLDRVGPKSGRSSGVQAWDVALQNLIDALGDQGKARDKAWLDLVATRLGELARVRERYFDEYDVTEDPNRERLVADVSRDPAAVLDDLEQEDIERSILAPLVKRAQVQVKNQLVERVAQEFSRLEGPLNEWLAILGPEGTPSVSLSAVSTSGRPSVDIRAEVASGSTEGPHAAGYFSDAQLDMLGMAAHLARIERDHPGCAIVIDDPSDMLDARARKSFAGAGLSRLLGDHGGRPHQVILLTHDEQLVRDLWSEHRYRRPPLVQDVIEMQVSASGQDFYSSFASRSTHSVLARAISLVSDHWESDQDRLWFRAALAAHARQALEMFAKDVAFLISPAGLGLQGSSSVRDQSADFGKVAPQVRKALREVCEASCSGSHHISGRRKLDEVRDLLSQESANRVNPGVHSDVVIPEAVVSRDLLNTISHLSSLLEIDDQSARSDWVLECELAKILHSFKGCPDCRVGGQ